MTCSPPFPLPQVKEQLSVLAVVAGIEDFECDVVQCHLDELQQTLQGLQIHRGEQQSRAERGEVVQSWSIRERQAGSSTGRRGGREGGVAKRQRGGREGAGGGGSRNSSSSWRRSRRRVPPAVDVVAVCSLMRLMDYGEEGSSQGPSARDVLVSVSCALGGGRIYQCGGEGGLTDA